MGNWLKSGLFSNKARGSQGEIQIPPMPKYKKYVALLTQTGTDAPIATVLENTIGDIVWSYESVGHYIGTIDGYLFPAFKTLVICSVDSAYGDLVVQGGVILQNIHLLNYSIGSPPVLVNPSWGDGGPFTHIEIRVYQ